MIYLFRHGETQYNLQNKFLSRTDVSLCEAGIARFNAIADKLGSMNCQAIYSSGLKRAKQSASILSMKLNVPHHVSPELSERDLGVLEGKSKADKRYVDIIPNLMDLQFIVPESSNVNNTLLYFSIEIAKIFRDNGGDVVVVSHGGIIALYLKHILKVNKDNIFLDNGAYHVLDQDEQDVIYIKQLNQII